MRHGTLLLVFALVVANTRSVFGRFAVQPLMTARTTLPLPGTALVENTLTKTEPSGATAIPPGSGNWPGPPRCCTAPWVVALVHGIRTMSPGGPPVGWNISVARKKQTSSLAADVF